MSGFLLVSCWCFQFVVLYEPAISDLLLVVWAVLNVFTATKLLARNWPVVAVVLIVHTLPYIFTPPVPYQMMYSTVTLYVLFSCLIFQYWFSSLTTKHLAWLLESLVWINVCAILWYFFTARFIDHLAMDYYYYDRLKGLFKDPNVFAAYLLIPAYWLMYTWKSRYYWRLIPLVILIVAIIESGSRVAFICLFIPFVMKWLRMNLKGKLLSVCLSILFLSLLVMFTDRYALQPYDGTRFSNQLVALQVAFSNPFGQGGGSSEQLLSFSPHQTYIRVLLENGILGLCAYLSFLVLTIKRLYFSMSFLSPVLLQLVISLMLMNLVIDTLHWRHGWLLLAMAWAVGREKNPNRVLDHSFSSYWWRAKNSGDFGRWAHVKRS